MEPEFHAHGLSGYIRWRNIGEMLKRSVCSTNLKGTQINKSINPSLLRLDEFPH